LRKSNGFTLSESISALSMWLLIVTILVPQMVLIAKERENTMRSVDAHRILHEETQLIMIEHQLPEEKVILKNQIEYKLSIKEGVPYHQACLEWKNASDKEESTCFFYQK